MPPTPPRCPRCRALGLPDDCTDRIRYRKGRQMLERDAREETADLLVTVTFPLVTFTEDGDNLRERATALRDHFIDEPHALAQVVGEAIGDDDYDVQVRLFDEP